MWHKQSYSIHYLPHEAFSGISHLPGAVLLETQLPDTENRYSYLAYEPETVFEADVIDTSLGHLIDFWRLICLPTLLLVIMEIIYNLEFQSRGVYTGVIGYAWQKEMAFNVAIRTLELVGQKVVMGSGGGIVVDYEPEAEDAESLLKTKATMEALRIL